MTNLNESRDVHISNSPPDSTSKLISINDIPMRSSMMKHCRSLTIPPCQSNSFLPNHTNASNEFIMGTFHGHVKVCNKRHIAWAGKNRTPVVAIYWAWLETSCQCITQNDQEAASDIKSPALASHNETTAFLLACPESVWMGLVSVHRIPTIEGPTMVSSQVKAPAAETLGSKFWHILKNIVFNVVDL